MKRIRENPVTRWRAIINLLNEHDEVVDTVGPFRGRDEKSVLSLARRCKDGYGQRATISTYRGHRGDFIHMNDHPWRAT